MIYKFWNFLKILWKFWIFFLFFLILWNMLVLKFYENFGNIELFWKWDFLEISKFYYPLPIIINIYWTPSLPMVFWPPYPWYIKPSLMYYELLSFGRNEGGGVQNTMTKNWPWGQNIIGKSTPGSVYHGVQNTIWHRALLLD